MSEQSPYEQLGVTVDASFDEIQDARNRLREQYSGERQLVESIEAAYDAILMDRLKLRQEGKIKVPERIRFAEERVLQKQKASTTVQQSNSSQPQWLQRMLDTPTRSDVLWTSAMYGGLSVLTLYPEMNIQLLQLPLALGVGAGLYFLNRKENQFGRAVLLTVSGLIIGLILGSLLSPMGGLLEPERFITLVTLIVLWLVSCFLK
ncbi:CPP1-like family protein [Capilliphycus salinus ALCB114379]|uniref:CPP1-like family protein n=1 Tax=Capilliphycus salinus TaxID=2768948 RepID=UPI0039A5331C